MSRYVFTCIFFVISANSCIFEAADQRYTNYHYITNLTGKEIIHELICDSKYVQEDTFRYYSDGLTEAAELEWKISCVVGKVSAHIPALISYSSFNIYNIRDTSFLHWKSFFGGYDNPMMS
jgi:hypothetical protein